MVDDLLRRAVREFGLTVEGSGTQPGGQSGAGVWAARSASGASVYLKVAPAGPPAQRELRFYRDVAPIARVRTPALLDWLDDGSGVALLLAAAGAPRDPAAWTDAMWASLGVALAAVHDLPVPAGGPPALPPLEGGFWAGRLPELDAVLAEHDALHAATNALPLVFTHGDCHAANLLHGPDGLVLCDWQSSGPGRPSADLAFPSVRATPSGTVVPAALADAYLDSRPVDRAILTRAVVAEELLTFLHAWPPYAAHHSPAGVARVAARTRSLARTWLKDR